METGWKGRYQIGDIINGTYIIRRRIAEGGMSSVYLAEHLRLGTESKWAVKEVSKRQAGQFDFLAEPDILTRLDHPMLPKIVDIEIHADHICIVESYVEGENLETYLQRHGPVDRKTGLRWFRDLAGVFQYLHNYKDGSILYRDMKPGNLMRQPAGTLKIVDFGISQIYRPGIVTAGNQFGTLGYAAPEMLRFGRVDARTDIYALGVSMYRILTGEAPGEKDFQIPPESDLVETLSPVLARSISKCTRPLPKDRYQSAAELMQDLQNPHIFEKPWKRYRNIQRLKTALILLLLAASLGLIATGWLRVGEEREAKYSAYLTQAEAVSADYTAMSTILDRAQDLFPERPDADRMRVYALYAAGRWQECIDCGTQALKTYEGDVPIRLAMASAQFELGDYARAAEGFAQGAELSADNLRDYAVCLGRLGRTEEAQLILERMVESGASSSETRYVQAEAAFMREAYLEAEAAFLDVIRSGEASVALVRRCYVSLGDLYRTCASLVRTGKSPIEHPATKAVDVLAEAVSLDGLRYDTVLWEALAMAYYESYHTDTGTPIDYLYRSANCFNRLLEQGVEKEYVFSNLYTIYYELENYEQAETVLQKYEDAYPDSYMPHAFRGVMLIHLENQKSQESRNYTVALREYEMAGRMIRGSDDTTYYQQLESLIEELRRKNWL